MATGKTRGRWQLFDHSTDGKHDGHLISDKNNNEIFSFRHGGRAAAEEDGNILCMFHATNAIEETADTLRVDPVHLAEHLDHGVLADALGELRALLRMYENDAVPENYDARAIGIGYRVFFPQKTAERLRSILRKIGSEAL